MSKFVRQKNNKKSKATGFTEAELAAAAFARDNDLWTQKETNRDRKKRRSRSKSRKKSKKRKKSRKRKKKKSRSLSCSSVREPPKDPSNPLLKASDSHGYNQWRGKRKRSRSPEEKWSHEGFLTRSISPIRERTEGPMADTRTGQWQSRAGGVYLPPARSADADDEGEAMPSRYVIPLRQQIVRKASSRSRSRSSRSRKKRRRSPCYRLDAPEE